MTNEIHMYMLRPKHEVVNHGRPILVLTKVLGSYSK
jgi:hypothetical protein